MAKVFPLFCVTSVLILTFYLQYVVVYVFPLFCVTSALILIFFTNSMFFCFHICLPLQAFSKDMESNSSSAINAKSLRRAQSDMILSVFPKFDAAIIS